MNLLKNSPLTIATIDGRFYPIYAFYNDTDAEVLSTIAFIRWDSTIPFAQHGRPTHGAASFPTQGQALAFCDRYQEESRLKVEWNRLAATNSDCYLERCAHYRELIEQISGHPPLVTVWHSEVSVMVNEKPCSICKHVSPCFSVEAVTLEGALEEAAERVYAARCSCEQAQETRLQLVEERATPVSVTV